MSDVSAPMPEAPPPPPPGPDPDPDPASTSPVPTSPVPTTPTAVPSPPALPPAPPPPRPPADVVAVLDPVISQDGMGKYTSYRVEVRPAGPPVPPEAADAAGGSSPPSPPVHRRYRDFSWLHSALGSERPGAVVPPLPDKQKAARFEPKFVEERRRQLELFLRRAVAHPELADAGVLAIFLRADDASLAAAKITKPGATAAATAAATAGPSAALPSPSSPPRSPLAAAPPDGTHEADPASAAIAPLPPPGRADLPIQLQPPHPSASTLAGRNIRSRLKKLVGNTKTQLTQKELVRSPDDGLFEEIETYATVLEGRMKTAASGAEALSRQGRQAHLYLASVGHALNAVGQDHDDGAGAGAALRAAGEALAGEVAPEVARRAEEERVGLEATLAEGVKYAQALRSASAKRRDRRLTYTTALNKLGEKRASLAKFHGLYHGGHDMKRYDAELSLQRAELGAEAARLEYEGCSQRLLREMDRFRSERAEELRSAVVRYVRDQATHTARMATLWEGLGPDLEAVPLGDGAGSGSGSGPAVAPAAYFSQGEAGRIPPIPAAMSLPLPTPAPLQHSMMIGQVPPPPGPEAATAAAAAPPMMVAPAPNGGDGGATMIGGMMYRSTIDAVEGM